MKFEYRAGRAVTAAQFHFLRKARAELTKVKDEINDIKSGKAAIPDSRQNRWVGNPSNRIQICIHHALMLWMFTILNAESTPNSSWEVGAMRTTVG